ncbi:putative zinc-finger containing protein [Pseudomonas phage VSW-3]|uniref:Putative zinc-finger containing protein n=1 Tax=Pseudomonas phage VSW-3 TaxID=1852562 RepID=A0A173GD24_9CAUD|nr:putative zinc-finger containing protein [Pseudomonas phage VSW-3]ANH51113.1 putative zinc-finger containing protein [Pseudomonas phage VSW-3]
MASGFAGDDGVNDTIEANVNNELDRVRASMSVPGNTRYCDECGEFIPLARRNAVPWTRYCVKHAPDTGPSALINRRGSKDSQLR